ncbi:hypothetical protein V8E51_005693 [Hyaloscypha variabilis]|uniref:Uncharacterized protein n=1 Tax=Hyaloscypha variabilis (strain UAMH 11265 / GT02V1 / F) TaxID=1149755 RepID=A0A2J6S3E2_HYAVF|nr:hypothetical protein L207DRAFT_562498 [Hyaloscypha variabilis F]
MSRHTGTKVTDPNAPSIQESAGPVASDSLAAESTREGGGFSENRNSEPQGVAGANSTFANANTSGAHRLDPASDAEARLAQEDWEEERKLGAGANSYPAAAGGQSKGLAVENTEGSHQTGGATSAAGTAPSYVNSQFQDQAGPHGKNLTEGGFESNDSKNASFNQEIGTKNDPGRLAEEKIFRANADTAGDASMPRQKGVTGDNEYDALGGDTPA